MVLRIASYRFEDGAGTSPGQRTPVHPMGVVHILKWEMSGILGLGETVNVGSVPRCGSVRVRRRCVNLGEVI